MATLGDFVTVDAGDVALGWRSLTSEQVTAVEKLLDRAGPILVVQSPGLLDRLAAGTVPAEAVEQVLIEAVRRAAFPMFNPDGVKKFSRSGDDYSESMEWDAAALAAGLYFTDRELAGLGGSRAGRRGKAFTINTAPEASRSGYYGTW